MHARVLLLALLVPALAGCIASPQSPAPLAAPPALPAAAEPFRFLLCDGGVLAELLPERDAPCNVQVTHTNGPAAEVSVAVNPRDPRNLVGGAKDFTLGEDERCGKHNVWSGVYASLDGGRTWSNGLLPGHPGDERTTALSDYACGSDPVLAFGPEGNVYYASIHFTDNSEGRPLLPQLGPIWPLGGSINAALAVTRSRDGGRTWDDPVLLGTKTDGPIFDKEWLAVDPRSGQAYVTAIDTENSELRAWRSDDQGSTWSGPFTIASPQDAFGHQFGQVAVGPDGVVHYTYWASLLGNDVSSIYHRASDDGGATWSAPLKVTDFFFPVFDLQVTHKYRVVPTPALAIDAASGALYVSYPDRVAPSQVPPAGPDMDLYTVASTDGGSTWSGPVRVNDDALGALNGQWMSALAVGPDGTVHQTWLDYRDDPLGQFAHVYYSFSRDGGATWSPNARLSDVATDGTGGYHQSGSGTIGDYMGLAASELGVTAFWADTRNQRNDVFSALVLG